MLSTCLVNTNYVYFNDAKANVYMFIVWLIIIWDENDLTINNTSTTVSVIFSLKTLVNFVYIFNEFCFKKFIIFCMSFITLCVNITFYGNFFSFIFVSVNIQQRVLLFAAYKITYIECINTVYAKCQNKKQPTLTGKVTAFYSNTYIEKMHLTSF